MANLDTLAAYLTDGYWEDKGSVRRAFDTSGDNVITVDITGLTADGKKMARLALDAWEAVADLEFQEVTDDADISFSDDGSGAYGGSTHSGGTILSAYVNVPADWASGLGNAADVYRYQTYVHEIGHALGLGHQGDYDGSATYDEDATFANDSWQVSIMSYFSQTDNTTTDASKAYLGTAMISDTLAIQDLYGKPGNGSETAGNTIYGANTTISGHLGDVYAAIMGAPHDTSLISGNDLAATIYDQSGTDTINLGKSTADNRLDLRPETFSDIGGLAGNLAIARGTTIENATGGRGDDKILGNGAGNVLKGKAGQDTLLGRNGQDTLKGGGGGDTLRGHQDHDTLQGHKGHDTLVGNKGKDMLKGHAGDDLLKGGNFHDTLKGGAGSDMLKGGAGRDRLLGGGGNDTLTGGGKPDRFVFNTNANTGDDVITDFEDGTDLIKMTGSADFGDLTIRQAGGDTAISWDNGAVTLDGVTGGITEDDFIFV